MTKFVTLTCYYCKSSFQRIKNSWRYNNPNRTTTNLKHSFCSSACFNKHRHNKVELSCKQCNHSFLKYPNQIKKSKSGNHFCSRSCAVTYNNTHKTRGTRRSKLEIYLEEQLRKDFPNLKLLCNDKSIINSELDFFFPELRFAIELNGIFHYEPIYGQDKLEKIQNNDKQKLLRCAEEGIELAIVDSSSCKRLTQKSKDKYYSIVKNLVTSIQKRAE